MKVNISSDREMLQMDRVQDMLSKVYWSPGITKNEIQKGIINSAFIAGAYTDDGEQVGFLRVVSDKVRFAYVMDVVVNENFQRQGIGQKMLKFTLTHPELKDVYIWLLATNDAHGVYAKCGFKLLESPEKWMAIRMPRPERHNFYG
jgi:GNAT superfamily N-acetyltransferase